MNVRAFAASVGGTVTGPQSLLMPGPGHSKTDRSLSVLLSPNAPDGLVVHTFCPHDDALLCKDYVRNLLGWDRANRGPLAPRRRDVSPTAKAYIDVKPHHVSTPHPRALKIWRGATSVSGTPAERYLRRRGFDTWPPSLRYSNIEKAMVAALQLRDREVSGVQLTRLYEDGKKYGSDDCRRTIGTMYGGAVRLAAAAGSVLGLAEGTETGLAAMTLFDIPVWASLGATRLSRVVIPDNIQRIEVFADNDTAGRAAADLAFRTHRNRKVVVHFPPAEFGDWNDVLLAERFVTGGGE